MNTSQLSDQHTEAIEEIHNRWIREELCGNNAQIIELCANNIKWIPPDAPPIVGKEAIAHYLNENVVELKDVQISDLTIRGNNSVAYLTCNYCSRFIAEGSSVAQEATGTHLWILCKTADSGWLVALVAWSLWGLAND